MFRSCSPYALMLFSSQDLAFSIHLFKKITQKLNSVPLTSDNTIQHIDIDCCYE